MNSIIRWLPSEYSVMRAAERIHPAEWIPKRFRLPRNSAIKGYCDIGLIPQFHAVFDWVIDDDIEEIYLCSGSQSAKTTVITACVSYVVYQKKWSAGIVFADQLTAEEVSEKRWAAAWEDDPVLGSEVDYSNWKKTDRGCIGGHSVKFAWASSVVGTASWSAGIVYADEIDKPPYSQASKEGDKMYYIKQRMESYWGAKFLASSTPTDEEGNITAIQNQADVLVHDLHVPCPYCGQRQPLKFSPEYAYGFTEGKYRAEDGTMHKLGRVVWEDGKEATPKQIQSTARYKCGECEKTWTTSQKNKALSEALEYPNRGVVPRTEPAGQRKYYLHNSRLTSLFKGGRLEKLVEEFVSILDEPDRTKRDDRLQAWIQNALAEPFKHVTLSTTTSAILQARVDLPPQTVPQEAVALYAFFDQQKHGYWFGVRAFAPDFTSWLIHYGYLTTEQEIEDLLTIKSYPQVGHESGMKIFASAYDTGGGDTDFEATMTERAYLFLCKLKRKGVRIWPTKGSSHPMPGRILKMGNKIQKLPSGQALPFALQLVELNTFDLKSKFHRRLSYAIEGNRDGNVIPGSAYLHSVTDSQYASHITAEEKRREKGTEVWVKIRDRNDLLDVEVGLHALADPEWPGGGVNMMRRQGPQEGESKPQAQPQKTQGRPQPW